MANLRLPVKIVLECLIAIAALSSATPALAAAAPVYPERPVRLVIGFAPGGTADTFARILTPRLHEALGQPWVVDNRSGASGNIATEIVARSNPDGYTVLLVLSTSLTVSPTLYKLPINVDADLQPVILLANAQYVLVVHPSIKANTVNDLVGFAKAQPGKLSYGSAGIGSPHQLAAELMKTRAGINMVHVPYKGGGPASTALLSNEVQVLFGSLSSLLPYVKSGRLKALGVTGLSRSSVLPETPTIAESGLPDFEVTSWFGLLVAARTPGAIVRTLYDTSNSILKMPDVNVAIRRVGLEVSTKEPEQFKAYIKAETDVWAKVIKAAGIRID